MKYPTRHTLYMKKNTVSYSSFRLFFSFVFCIVLWQVHVLGEAWLSSSTPCKDGCSFGHQQYNNTALDNEIPDGLTMACRSFSPCILIASSRCGSGKCGVYNTVEKNEVYIEVLEWTSPTQQYYVYLLDITSIQGTPYSTLTPQYNDICCFITSHTSHILCVSPLFTEDPAQFAEVLPDRGSRRL